MKIAYANAPLFSSRVATKWLLGAIVPKPGSPDEVGVEIPGPNGALSLSIEPGGVYSYRPAGTFGGYESFKVRDHNLVSVYTHEGVQYINPIPFVIL